MRPVTVAAALTLALSGCAVAAGTMRSYVLAPNGMESRDQNLRQALVAGAFDASLARIRKKKNAPEDKLLRLLYEGAVAHYAGRYDASVRALDRAQYLAEDRFTKSASRGALSLVTNDRALAYLPGQSERLLIHYYAALGFLARKDVQGAAVEARRLSFLLEMYDEQLQPGDRSLRAALRYFAGAVFEAAGEDNDAGVSYRNAIALGSVPADVTGTGTVARLGTSGIKKTTGRPGRRKSAPTETTPAPAIMGSKSTATSAADPALSAMLQPLLRTEGSGTVVLLLEQGFVAHRVSQSLRIFVDDDDIAAFDDDDKGARLERAQGVGARVVAQLSRDEDLYAGDTRRSRIELTSNRRHDAISFGGGGRNEHLITVSWPVYRRPRGAPFRPVIYAGDSVVTRLQATGDVTDAIVSDFRRARAEIAVRAVLRGATKYAAARAAEKKADDKKKADGKRNWKWEMTSVAVDAVGAALERADTRSWHLLPGSISVARVSLAPGRHTLTVDGGYGRGRTALGDVEVRAGEVTILSRRLWDGDALR